jgi:hypothetical protein
MTFSYRSSFPAALLGFGLSALGCAPLEPEVETLEIRAHSLDASERCRIVANPDLTLKALGPFPVSPAGAEVFPFRTSDRVLVFSDDVSGVEATADDGNRKWIGYSDRRAENGIDVLLWENGVGCELFDPDASSADYPGARAGQAIGYSPVAGVVLAAGGDTTLSSTSAAAGSLTFDSGTGKSDLVGNELGFSEARAYATVTPFGSKLLLAGGEDPFDSDIPFERATRPSAAVYDPATRGFEPENIELELGRTRHAAVELANGETLLVGGARPRGDGTTVIVPPFEAISPRTRRSRLVGLAELGQGRLEPVAIRLDNDNILVGGGYDASRNPMRSLEWFSADGSTEVLPGLQTDALAPRYHRAIVALPGGGALTVGGCEPASQTPECERACGAGFGCPSAAPDPMNASLEARLAAAAWISRDGDVTPIDFPESGPCGPITLARPLLAPGSDGSPWLLALDEDPSCNAVLRFQPWEKSPAFRRADLRLERWPDPRTPLTSLGPDAFVWLSEDDPPFLVGTRAGTRGALSQNETLLGTNINAPLVPEHLAPDRPPDIAPRAQFTIVNGGRLLLDKRTSADDPPPVGVMVTDTRYDDVDITVGFSSGFLGDGPPLLLLGAREIGTGDCAWPAGAVSPLSITRIGSELTVVDGRGVTTSCKEVGAGPKSIGFRAGPTSTTISSLTVRRR